MLGEFIEPSGRLFPVLEAVRADPQLDLEIRAHYVNIYYRGTNLMQIDEVGRGGRELKTSFEKRYLPRFGQDKTTWNPPPTRPELEVETWLLEHKMVDRQPLRSAAEAQAYVASFHYRKRAMDACKARRRKPERQAQQAMVWLHNHSPRSHYLICDMEYSFHYEHPKKDRLGKIDLVAARFPGTPDATTRPRFVLIELKCGPNAIDGEAGLQKHVEDLGGLMKRADLQLRAEEMVEVVRQKHELGLLPMTIAPFDLDAPLEYLIAVAQHNPRSQRLHDALQGNPDLVKWPEPLVWPDGVEAKVVILNRKGEPDDGDNLLLEDEKMIAFEQIAEDGAREKIFSGTTLRDRRPRAARLAAATG